MPSTKTKGCHDTIMSIYAEVRLVCHLKHIMNHVVHSNNTDSKLHNAPFPNPQSAHSTSHNAPLCNRNIYIHTCTFLLRNGALWDICLMHCGICEIPLVCTPFSLRCVLFCFVTLICRYILNGCLCGTWKIVRLLSAREATLKDTDE